MSPTTRSKDHGKSEKVENAETGSKHKMTDTEGPENPKPAPKKQKTIEETIDKGSALPIPDSIGTQLTRSSTDYMGNNKSKVKEEDKGTELKTRRSGSGKDKQHEDPKEKPEPKKSKSKAKAQKDEPKSDPAPDDQQEEEGFTSRTNSKSKAQPEKKQTPQTGTGKSTAQILERGIIYFFLRGRVNTDTPSSVSEIARTYFLLRPMTPSSPPSNLPSSLANKCRVLVVPKKTFPTSGRERWISFVEKVGASFADLKDSFLGGNDYETKTRGTQHTPAAKPEGEGVYMITNTGRDSHLSYVLTRPRPVEEVQRKLGLMEHGTFVLSTRNPEFKSPGNARLPEGPEFPEE